MFKIRTLLAMAASIVVLSCDTAPRKQETFEEQYDRVSVEMMDDYGLEPPQLEIERFRYGVHGDTLAKTECTIWDGTPRCRVVFQPCAVDIRNQDIRENLIAHEIAHYINARVNNKFDHGREWVEILEENGYEAMEQYPRWVTRSCE